MEDEQKVAETKQMYKQIIQKMLSRKYKLRMCQFSAFSFGEEDNIIKLLIETAGVDGGGVMTQVFIDEKADAWRIKSYLLENNLPYCVSQRYTVGILVKIIQKLNLILSKLEIEQQKFNNLSFEYSPFSGIISLNFKVFLISLLNTKVLSSKQTHIQISSLAIEIINIVMELKPYFKFMLEEGPCPQMNISLKSLKLDDQIKKINFLREQLEQSARYFDINYQHDQDFDKHPEIFKNYFLSHHLPLNSEIQSIHKVFNLKEPEVCGYPLSKFIQNLFQYSCSLASSEGEQCILREVKIITDPQYIKWDEVGKGGFGLIEKAEVNYEISDYDQIKTEVCRRFGILIKKSDYTKNNKIFHEKKILTLLKWDSHPNIMSYYISKQPYFENYLFCKYEPEASLDEYIHRNKRTFSLQTIISILNQAVHGLYFLKFKEIVHLDIKPGNIIITSRLKARIGDFGEAIELNSQKLEDHKQNHAITFPYAAPQLFDRKVSFNEKIDVYSMGVTIYKCIFGQHLFSGYREKGKFIRELKMNRKKIWLSPERIHHFGMKILLNLIVCLCIRCCGMEQGARPTLSHLSTMFEIYQQYIKQITN